MAIVAAFEYHNGHRAAPVDLASSAPVAKRGKGNFAWVGLFEPTPEEMQLCTQRFKLHPLAVEDALHPHQLPKLELYGEQLFIVARTARIASGRIEYGETAYFLGHDFLVSVRHGSDLGHSQLRERLEERPQALKHGVDFVLHSLLDLVVDNYFPVIDAVRAEVEALEQDAVEASLNREQIRRLFALRRDLLGFQRMLLPMEDLCAKLANLDLPAIDTDVRPYFRDVLDHVRRVSTLAAMLRDVLGSVVETSALIAQQHQADITRTLAAWAAILAVPTAIAGIYGMNFDNMPELHTRYGYFVVMGVIGLICTGLFVRFRRIGWL